MSMWDFLKKFKRTGSKKNAEPVPRSAAESSVRPQGTVPVQAPQAVPPAVPPAPADSSPIPAWIIAIVSTTPSESLSTARSRSCRSPV